LSIHERKNIPLLLYNREKIFLPIYFTVENMVIQINFIRLGIWNWEEFHLTERGGVININPIILLGY